MICKFCGKEINDDADVCVHCGKILKESPAPSSEAPRAEVNSAQTAPANKDTQNPAHIADPAEQVYTPVLGFILSLVAYITFGILSVIGLIVSSVEFVRAKKVGGKTTYATAGIVLGVIGVVIFILGICLFRDYYASIWIN